MQAQECESLNMIMSPPGLPIPLDLLAFSIDFTIHEMSASTAHQTRVLVYYCY